MNTIDLQVEGMSCGSCVKHVTQALQSLPGVGGVEVDLTSGRVRVSGELAPGGDSLLMALTEEGYPSEAGHRRLNFFCGLAADSLVLPQRQHGGLRLPLTAMKPDL